MTTSHMKGDWARDDVSASSAGGAPFLIAYGATIFITAILYYFLPLETVALIAIFQGNVALPLAFWLERRLAAKRMDINNPLKQLSIQIAMTQVVALPAVILVYNLYPVAVPATLAAIGGGHFLPYAWLHRNPIYFVLGVVLSVGAFALQIIFKSEAFPYVLFFMSLLYWLIAPLVYRHAGKLVGRQPA